MGRKRGREIFKRGRSEPEPTADFWSWWSGGRDRVAEAITAGAYGERLVSEISRAVETIHPRMAWELAPGGTARHAFCISPEGNAELRQVALRWLASAPLPDATWEYHASKQAAEVGGLDVADRRFDLREMRAVSSWDPARRRVDVRLWHPWFAETPELVKLTVCFLFLDKLLGEEDVERWVGQIDLLEEGTGGRTPAELKAEIERQKAEPAGGDTWILSQRTEPDGAIGIVSGDAGLKRIDHPFADTHVTIDVLFGADRMPTEPELRVLKEQQEELLRRLGDVAIHAGKETAPGKRTLHFVAENPDLMRPAIDSWAQDWPYSLSEGLPQVRLKINFARDMDWSFQRDLGVR